MIIVLQIGFTVALLPMCDSSLSQDFYKNTIPVTVASDDTSGDCRVGDNVDLTDDLGNIWTIRQDSSNGVNLCETWPSNSGDDTFDNALVYNLFLSFFLCVVFV